MPNETETELAKSEEVAEETKEETQDTTDYKALYEKAEAERKEEANRRKRAETALDRKRLNEAVETKVEKVLSKKEEEQTGEFSDAHYALLTAKGIEEDDEVDLAQKLSEKWKMPLRQLLKDEDFKAKLKNLRDEKAIKVATPTTTKRSGQPALNDVDHWMAKIDAGTARLGDAPYEIRSKIVAERERREGVNAPPWRR